MSQRQSLRRVLLKELSFEKLEQRQMLDGGMAVLASVGGTVWEDLNANGLQDPGEQGMEGIEVALYQAGNPIIDRRTDANGDYAFHGLTPREYSLRFIAPDEFAFSPQDQGDDDALDSDPQPLAGRTFVFTLVGGQDDLSRDAGLFRTASLAGRVWDDVSRDGLQDWDEGGVAGVSVHLLDDQLQVIESAKTNAAGGYAFAGLLPGEYSVEFVAFDGAVRSPADEDPDDALDSDANAATGRTAPITLLPGAAMRQDAGLYGTLPTAVVDGLVWRDADGDGIRAADECGVGAVQVRFLDLHRGLIATTTTAANGAYLVGLPAGVYRAEFVLPEHHTFAPMDRGHDDTVDSDVNRSTAQTVPFTLLNGQDGPTLDAGLYSGEFSDSVTQYLRVTEIMFMAGRRDFIELKNISSDTPLDLSAVRLSYGIVFEFDEGSLRYLFPGEHVLVVDNLSDFEDDYDTSTMLIAGQYDGSLRNDGERVRLEAMVNETILDFTYHPDWFAITERDDDEQSFTLTVQADQAHVDLWDTKSNWRPSSLPGGSPGMDDPRMTPDPGAVLISELMSFPSDAGTGETAVGDWIELHNTTDDDIDISGWYLDDDTIGIPELWRYKIPEGTIIPAHGYCVFTEQEHFGEYFGLNTFGEMLHLTAGDAAAAGDLLGYCETVRFGGAIEGVTFGRHSGSSSATTTVVFESEDVPMPIGNGGTAFSTLRLGGTHGIVSDINVTLDIDRLSNLTFALTSPAGTEIRLFSQIHGSGNNVIVDDEASLSVAERTQPYTDPFRPEEPLSRFDGENLDGTWTMRGSSIRRREPAAGGRLDRWSIEVTYMIAGDSMDFVAMSQPTMGYANAAPRVGPLVINEIMYHPAYLNDEFLELHNITDSPVDIGGWYLGGVGYTFSPGTVIPAEGYALVVPSDPATFRAQYGVPADVLVAGPFPGQLNDGPERLELIRTDSEGRAILIDQVEYDSHLPWPLAANQGGGSLERIATRLYGNNPSNWNVTAVLGGTPGAQNTVAPGGGCLPGDVNNDGHVNGLDVQPFVEVLLDGPYNAGADMNQDGAVNGLDVALFVDPLHASPDSGNAGVIDSGMTSASSSAEVLAPVSVRNGFPRFPRIACLQGSSPMRSLRIDISCGSARFGFESQNGPRKNWPILHDEVER